MFGSHAATALALVGSYGAVAVFAVFALEGALLAVGISVALGFGSAPDLLGTEWVATI